VAQVDVILLAGDRGPGDPLAERAGVAGKTLVPVAGQAMLTRVLSCVGHWSRLGRIILVVPSSHAYDQAIRDAGIEHRHLLRLNPEASPSLSVLKALEAAGPLRPVVLATADHPLLDADWLDQMVAQPDNGDLGVGLTRWEAVMQRFPGSRRTRYRFSDGSICGTNLFVFRTPVADRILKTWRKVEQERKRPWKVISLLGWSNLARYLAGALSLEAGLAALSQRLGIDIRPVMLPDPLTAVDVDKVEDLVLVEQVFRERDAPC
jgi:CTP:molybdopterin cytidylyltransferase MocA